MITSKPLMNKVILVFPNTSSLSDFIFKYRICGIEVSTRDRSLSGYISDEQVLTACAQYQAQLTIINRIATPTFSTTLS